MLNATPEGPAEQAARKEGGATIPKRQKATHKIPKKAKSQRTARKLPENCQNRQAGRRKVESGEKGGGEGKEVEVAEGPAEALAVRVAQCGHEVLEQFCSQLELGLSRARGLLPHQAQVPSCCEKT